LVGLEKAFICHHLAALVQVVSFIILEHLKDEAFSFQFFLNQLSSFN
jgi:hypothetical protein